jgi:tetratricopeptide (TPR) repeat protein
MVSLSVFAQEGKKPVTKEKPPTQKEINELMKEFENMSPEDRKRIEQMGIKVPSAKEIPSMKGKSAIDAFNAEETRIPAKDPVRIASIAKGVTTNRLNGYVKAVHQHVAVSLDADMVKSGEAIYAYLGKENVDVSFRGNTAIGLWSAGYPALALHVLGKACSDTPTVDNLSNYASMLTMLGGEHLAIPILENLDSRIPGNIILLNNLGQAWLGLGDLKKANGYFDSCVSIYPNHPQANMSIAQIALSKGENSKAIDAIKKSIEHAYTKEKEDMLLKLGYKLKVDDLRMPFKPDPDPLLLDRYKRPDYPKSVAESVAMKPQWTAFVDECNTMRAKLSKQLAEAGAKYSSLAKSFNNASENGGNIGGLPASMQTPLQMKKASLKMKERKEYFDQRYKELGRKFTECRLDLDRIQKERRACRPEEPCLCHRDAESEYLKKYNERKQYYDEEALTYFKQYYGEMVFLSQYTSFDDNQFEVVRLQLLIDFLGKLASFEFMPVFAGHDYEECKEDKTFEAFKLTEWDFSKNCKYTAEIKYPLIVQNINCGHTTTTFDASFLKNIPVVGMGAKYTWVDVGAEFERSTLVLMPKIEISSELEPFPISGGVTAEGTITVNTDKTGKRDWNAVVKAGIELGVGKSLGPLKAKTSIAESIEFEFDQKGLKDVNLVSELKEKVGIEIAKRDALDPANKAFNDNVAIANKASKISGMYVKIGIEGRSSLMAGHGSVKVKGISERLMKTKLSSW